VPAGARCHPPAIQLLARKRGEGKRKREALRSLKRHPIRVIYRTLTSSPGKQRNVTIHAPVRIGTPRLTWEQPARPAACYRTRYSIAAPWIRVRETKQ
jgi:hypothetical protein